MPQDILLATNNEGKRERYTRLIRLGDIPLVLKTPSDLGIEAVDVAETGTTLEENAQFKARAYEGQTDLPILGNDTGFWLEPEGFVDAPKRIALQGADEHSLTKEEIAQRLVEFWREKAKKYGGSVPAAWIDAFFLLLPDGRTHVEQSRRDITLTDTEHGPVHIQMPVRALYYSQTTGKPAAQHTEEEEAQEMQPIITALESVYNRLEA